MLSCLLLIYVIILHVLRKHIDRKERISKLDQKICNQYTKKINNLSFILVFNLLFELMKLFYKRVTLRLTDQCVFQTNNQFWDNVIYFTTSPANHLLPISGFLYIFWRKRAFQTPGFNSRVSQNDNVKGSNGSNEASNFLKITVGKEEVKKS